MYYNVSAMFSTGLKADNFLIKHLAKFFYFVLFIKSNQNYLTPIILIKGTFTSNAIIAIIKRRNEMYYINFAHSISARFLFSIGFWFHSF
jgi:hypothetical protein